MNRIPVTFYYYLSFSLMPVLGLLQTKTLTIILPPQTFGEIQLILPVLGWTVVIGGMGAPQFVIRFYNRDGIKAYQEGLFISVSVILIIGLISCFFLICFGANYEGLKISARMALMFLLAALTQQVVALVKSLLRVQERHVFYNAMSICAKIFLVAGVIIGVVWWSKFPIEGYLLGSAIASIAMLLLLIGLFRMKYIWKARIPSWISVSQLISYGFPIVCITLLGNLLPNLNRYVIFAKLDTSAVAKYAVGCMITALCFQALYEPLNTILHPRVFRAWEKNSKAESRKIITRYLNLYIIVGLIVCGLSVRFEDILLNIVANMNYRLPSGCFGVLLLSNFLIGIYRFVSIHYYLERNTTELGLIFFLSIIVNFSAALMLVGKTGLLGAAISVFLGTAVLTAAVWLRGQKNLRMKLFFKYHVLAFVVLLSLIFVPSLSSWNIYSPLRWLDAVVSFGIAACCGFFLIKVFDKNYKLLIVK